MDELIKDLREALYGPAQWGDTVLMSRAIDALTGQQSRITALEDEVKALRKDAERWRTEMQLRDNPTVAIFFYGNEGRCSIHRNGVVIAQGDTYAKAIDAVIALSAASDGGGDE